MDCNPRGALVGRATTFDGHISRTAFNVQLVGIPSLTDHQLLNYY